MTRIPDLAGPGLGCGSFLRYPAPPFGAPIGDVGCPLASVKAVA